MNFGQNSSSAWILPIFGYALTFCQTYGLHVGRLSRKRCKPRKRRKRRRQLKQLQTSWVLDHLQKSRKSQKWGKPRESRVQTVGSPNNGFRNARYLGRTNRLQNFDRFCLSFCSSGTEAKVFHRAELKVTDQRWRSPTCGFLQFSSKIFGFLRKSAVSCALQMLEFPGEGICENLRISAKSAFWALSVVRHLKRALIIKGFQTHVVKAKGRNTKT